MPGVKKIKKKPEEQIQQILHELRQQKPSSHKIRWNKTSGERICEVLC